MSQLKLNKLLQQGLSENSIELRDHQQALMTRVLNGTSIYLTGESSVGKTTSALVTALQRVNFSKPDTPGVVFLCSAAEDATLLFEKIKKIGTHMNLLIHLITENESLDNQNMKIYAGADIIVATPSRLNKLYFQCGINVNGVQLLILDDATKLADNRLLPEVERFGMSLKKFQSLIIDETPSPKIEKMVLKFSPFLQHLSF